MKSGALSPEALSPEALSPEALSPEALHPNCAAVAKSSTSPAVNRIMREALASPGAHASPYWGNPPLDWCNNVTPY
jgi:hypothetical protein